MEAQEAGSSERPSFSAYQAALVDKHKSPFENAADDELRARVEIELRKVSEPYRTAIVLRDIEDLSYEEIAEITQVSLGTVKSRITRGRDALRKILLESFGNASTELGLEISALHGKGTGGSRIARGQELEVTP